MRIRYILRCLFFYLSEFPIRFSRKTVQNNTNELLIVHTDAIGDYLLFRNIITELKNTSKYKNYRFTLCANQAYKDLATSFDSGIIDAFIWLDRSKFEKDISYRRHFIKSLRKINVTEIINPSYSHDFIFGDSIVRAVNARSKIGQVADTANSYAFLTAIAQRWYTKLMNTGNETVFEFYRNKTFAEQCAGESLTIDKPFISVHKQIPKDPYLVVFPGAGEKQKQWPIDRFAEIVTHITERTQLHVVVCGSTTDSLLGNQLQALASSASIQNLCGQTTLPELVDTIGNASFLLTNDSSALHIAACAHTPTICVGNGRHYGRFTPYPKGVAPHLHFIFPEKVRKMAQSEWNMLQKITVRKAIAPITDISVDEVKKQYNQLV